MSTQLFRQIRDLTDIELEAFASTCLQGADLNNQVFWLFILANQVGNSPIGKISLELALRFSDLKSDTTDLLGKSVIKDITGGTPVDIHQAARDCCTHGENGFGRSVVYRCLRIAQQVSKDMPAD